MTTADTDWRRRAACRYEEPDLFHHVESDALVRMAKAVCRRCEVIDACRAWADQIGDDHAVMGGTTPAERRRERRNRDRSYINLGNGSSGALWTSPAGTLRTCLFCRTSFAANGKARYCSPNCRAWAAHALRSAIRPRKDRVPA